jgi:predicted nucleic acid-binding Zn ribbon protein
LLRCALSWILSQTMAYAHIWWGEDYPADQQQAGQHAMAFFMVFALIGLAVAAFFFVAGSGGQFLFRKKNFFIPLFLDLALFAVLAAILVHMGATAIYQGFAILNIEGRIAADRL